MDADPITDSGAIAELAYDALIGSDFEKAHGWRVNLMPNMVLNHLPAQWKLRTFSRAYGNLTVTVPAADDLLAPKRLRNEPRDRQHESFAAGLGLI